jgi:hypothetical protein
MSVLIRRVSSVGVVIAVLLCLSAVALASAALPLTKAQYDSRATAICKHAKKSLNAVPSGGQSAAAEVNFLRAGTKIESVEVRSLKTLRPPVRLRALVRNGLGAKAKQVATMKSLAREAASGSLTLQQVFQGLLAMPQDTATWRKVGAPICQF